MTENVHVKAASDVGPVAAANDQGPTTSAEITPLAVAGDEQISPLTEWPSGVGGAQCDDCGRTTIVRATETDMLGNPETWQCRPCATGDDRFQYDDFQGDDHA